MSELIFFLLMGGIDPKLQHCETYEISWKFFKSSHSNNSGYIEDDII
jgi:hypothetical protein